jgi:hypothetical protein
LLIFGINAGEYDIFNPDYEKFPKLKNIKCYQVFRFGVCSATQLIYFCLQLIDYIESWRCDLLSTRALASDEELGDPDYGTDRSWMLPTD